MDQTHATEVVSPVRSAHHEVMGNGLTVLWEEDARQPLVAIEVRILGGVRGEGAYLGTGITHFIEHMLFKGTPTRPPGTIDKEIRQYGGSINAFTSLDYTGITLYVESAYLRETLELLADILQHAVFSEEEFLKERNVIVSEIQMNQDDVERRLHHLFWSRHLRMHPYGEPILGHRTRLDQLTVEDLQVLYGVQYVPNNIIIACVGAIPATTFMGMLEETFGDWSRGAPYRPSVQEEPPALGMRHGVETLPIQHTYIMLGFPSTRLAHPDLFAMDVLASILGRGRSSRLHEALVRESRLAHTVGASNYTPLDPGAFSVSMRVDAEHADAAVEGVLEVMGAIVRDGVSSGALKKAKRQVVADHLFHQQTIGMRAGSLANAVAMTGDPDFATRYVEGIAQVTAKAVQEVAGRYLDRNRMTLVQIQPEGSQADVDGTQPTEPMTVRKTVLSNGLTVLLGMDRRLPLGVITLAGRGGVRAETDATQGLSNLVAQLLLKGTKERTASEIAEFVESMGADIHAISGKDGLGLSMEMLGEDLQQGLDLLHELVTESTFPEDELELLRGLLIKSLEARDDDIFDVGSRLMRRTLFKEHPYRFDPGGSKSALQQLTRAQCVEFARRWRTAGNLVLAVVGDFNEADMLAQLTRQFGALPNEGFRGPAALSAKPLEEIRQAGLRMPKEQAVVLLGFRGASVVSPDRDALDVLTAVLSGMSGRLFQAVREKQGLSYVLGAANVPGSDPGYVLVYAATRPEEREQTLATIQDQLRKVVEEGLTEEEVDQAKRHLIGGHRLGLQRLSGMAHRVAFEELYGVGYDAWASYEDRVSAVTVPILQDVARRYLTMSRYAEVTVGPLVPETISEESNGGPVQGGDGR